MRIDRTQVNIAYNNTVYLTSKTLDLKGENLQKFVLQHKFNPQKF